MTRVILFATTLLFLLACSFAFRSFSRRPHLSVVTLEATSIAEAQSKRSYGVGKKYWTSTIDLLQTASSLMEDKQFDWDRQWYPVAVEEFTDKNKPNKIMFLGHNVVLWYDGSTWKTFDDSCPHRGVPLSEGRVEKNGELLCAYHAWRFDGTGQCTAIPQSDSKEKEAVLCSKTCVPSYPTQVMQGLIWVWGETCTPGSDSAVNAALKSPRLIEELTDPRYKDRIGPIVYNFRDIPYGWDMFMENTLDPAHVAVSHHGIVGNRYTDPRPIELIRTLSTTEIPKSLGGELDKNYPEDAGFKYFIRIPGAQPDGSESSNDFRPPSLNKITTEYANDKGKLILALYATPTSPGYCRHIGAQILIKDQTGKYPQGLGMFALPMPKWLLHVTASLFLHQDQVFLHHQERMLYSSSKYAFGNFSSSLFSNIGLTSDPKAYKSTYFMPNSHDKQITDLRNWIHKKAGGGVRWGAAALVKGLPQRLNEAELFDVYESHTKNCATCTTAVNNIKTTRNVSLALAVLSISLLKAKFGIALGAFFSVVSAISHQLRKLFYKYEFTHQSNN